MKKLSILQKVIIGVIILVTFLSALIYFMKINRNNSFLENIFHDYILRPFNLVPKTKNNEKLLNDSYIIELKNEIDELKKVNEIKNIFTDFELVNASVISRNKSYYFQTLMIDKGTSDGIKQNMAVITKEGLVGKISKTSKYSSEVKLITSNDSNFKISVSILTDKGKINAYLDGYDKKSGRLKVTGVDKMATINEGQMVITSGLGGVFPSGIHIGVVVSVKDEKYGMSKQLELEPSKDLNNLSYLTILKREIKE